MKRRSRGAKWFVLGFYILGVELFIISRISVMPNIKWKELERLVNELTVKTQELAELQQREEGK